MMIFQKNSAAGLTSASKLISGPYDTFITTEQTEIAVPIVAPPAVLVGPGNSSAFAILRNTSPAVQQIRFGSSAPSFTAPVQGQLLKPGEQVTLTGVGIAILAIADVAGALCSRFVLRTSGISAL